MTISTKKNNKSKPCKNETILDRYSPLQVGKILRTSTKKKPCVFDTLRPKSEENLAYNISQTDVKFDYGPTKINVKSTRATYTALSEEAILAKMVQPKKEKYSHGAPPLEHYVEDLWLARQNLLQEKYRQELRLFVIRRKKRDRFEGGDIHNTIQAMVGPEWYQELSPKQLYTADQLENCILRDLKLKTIINTQENIASLGLVLRPNYRNIKKALKYCCKCPVEFLLILYQLIDPKRSTYSLNDRLLLSAVVHLTMRETLREMHVRIPSPPPPEKFKMKLPKKEKPEKYESPYLEPYTFKPPPRKHTGIYVNTHVQYPESPYFDYRDMFFIERDVVEDIFEIDLENLEPDEIEIIEEVKAAQAAYDSIQKNATYKKKLNRPVKKPLSDFLNRLQGTQDQELELVLPPLQKLPPDSDDDAICECNEAVVEMEDICCGDFMTPCGECGEECKCREMSQKFFKCKKCLARERRQNLKRVIGGVKKTPSDNVISIIGGTLPAKDECDCFQKYNERLMGVTERNKLLCEQAQFALGGVVKTQLGPVYNISTAIIERKDPNAKEEEKPDICCKANKRDDNEPQPCTCCGKYKQTPDDICCGTNQRSDNTCGMLKEAGDNDNVNNESENVPCTCGTCDIEDETSNKEIVPCYDCQCGKEPCSPDQCTCEQGPTKKKSKHKDDDEEEFCGPCECEGVCDCKKKSKLYTSEKCPRCQARQRLKFVQRIIGGLKSRKNKYVPLVEGTRQFEECGCLQKYKDKLMGVAARSKIRSRSAKFILGGVVLTKNGPVYILSTAFIEKPRKEDSIDDFQKMKKKSKLHDEHCICEDCKHKGDSSEEEEIIKYSACRCREELNKFLAQQCICEDCNIEERQRNATHVIAGAKYTQSGTVVKIMQGIQEQRCDCLRRYLQNVKKLDDYRERFEARTQLMSQDLKYSIGGVVSTSDGPVYVISGMRPPVECDCAKEMRRQAEEELHLKRMAKMPPTGRIKYQISGVAETPEGNVYIVSQALPIDDCDCVRLYNTFKEAHGTCLDSYTEYLSQVQEETEAYEAEAAATYRKSDANMLEENEDDVGYDNVYYDAIEETAEDIEEKTELTEPVQPAAVTCECPKKNELSSSSSGTSSGTSSSTSNDTHSETSAKHSCTCVTPPVSEEDSSEDDEGGSTKEGKTDSKRGSLKGDKTKGSRKGKRRIGKKGGKKIGGQLAKRKAKKIEEYHTKRFYLTEKIPCDSKKQIIILKKILESMAADGFPLAKLPDSYKLPHFKLWMQLRCGKFWTQEDKGYYENFTKVAYGHTNHCYREPPRPNLGMSRAEAEYITWKDAAYVRKLVSEKIGMYYRIARQVNVETAREYYPLTFSYEFPTKTFRDCFFAYMPSKEEDTLVYRIIKPYDTRVILKKYNCYC